jgi:hypothetical protein
VYQASDRLWRCNAPFVPIPRALLLGLPDLAIPHGSLPVLLALVAATYHLPGWPVVLCSWRTLARATGLSKAQVRRHAKVLRLANVLDWTQPLGRTAATNRFDFTPLIELICAVHGIDRPAPRRHDPLAQLPLIPSPEDPRPQILADVRRRRADAIAAARRDISEPPPSIRVTVIRQANT